MEVGLIGPGVAALIFVIGGVGTYFTYKAKVDALTAKIIDVRTESREEIESAQRRATEADNRTRDLEVRIEREFVKKNDLASVEDRIGKRLDQVAHDVKGAITQIIPALAGLRNARAPARGQE